MINNRNVTAKPLSIKNFFEQKGLKEYKGIKGFDNLMIIMKADMRSLFLDHSLSKRNAKEQERIDVIQKILDPYTDYWTEWSISNFCSLTELEVHAINYYRLYRSHKEMATLFQIPYSQAYTHFKNALRTLKSPSTYSKFQEWIHSTKTHTPEQKFLNAPIIGLRSLLSTRSCFAFARIENTLGELLAKHTKQDLLQYRGIGTTSINELKKILKTHDCLSLLKDK